MEEVLILLLPMVITTIFVIVLDGLFSAFAWLVRTAKESLDW